jgi:ribose transport system substrate-binding protein
MTARTKRGLLLAGITAALLTGVSAAQAFEAVSGPASEPDCMVPWSADTKFYQFPKKEGPYRIALANGYIANTWRIQMIQTAKAYAAQPEVAAKLKEFKVVSTGEDVPAQISAINNFIDAGYDSSTPRMRSTSTSTRRASASCGRTG